MLESLLRKVRSEFVASLHGPNGQLRGRLSVITYLLPKFTGPPMPITARVHSTPQIVREGRGGIEGCRRGELSSWRPVWRKTHRVKRTRTELNSVFIWFKQWVTDDGMFVGVSLRARCRSQPAPLAEAVQRKAKSGDFWQ
eukprot:9492223-Pyramimonas_sp.AAC.1